ncbi:uncharacterized protein LOC127115363 [Lathyrus oleraceus]|uniref:uncharacterized protein LOC127115363 n=1 Tax=Pisum sativum TaxID=3888 RepID=UPI0021D17C15|nr:uncharacterized protein LOC127115363 [Pisum sativum]
MALQIHSSSPFNSFMISFCFPFQFIHKLKTYFRHSFTNSFFFLFQLFHSIFSEFTSTMARPIESVMDINDSKDLWKIVVRCRHLWTVRSSSNKEHLELILVDSKLDMIQAIVPSHLVSKYVGDLAVGASYIMQIHVRKLRTPSSLMRMYRKFQFHCLPHKMI